MLAGPNSPPLQLRNPVVSRVALGAFCIPCPPCGFGADACQLRTCTRDHHSERLAFPFYRKMTLPFCDWAGLALAMP